MSVQRTLEEMIAEAQSKQRTESDYEGAKYGRNPTPEIAHGEQPAAEPVRATDECQNCGRETDATLRRLFGDNAGILWHCQGCLAERTALGLGAGADPDWNPDQAAGKQVLEVLEP